MDHSCENCGYFFEPGQAGGMIQEGCPNCGRPYREQPSPLNSEMSIRDMPEPGGGDDMGGNPLMEGMLADSGWRNQRNRDESFASVHANDLKGLMWLASEADFPIEDAQITEPSPQYTEAANLATIHLPQSGISDNLHQALTRTNAWVENPYENGRLRPYNKYWQVMRNRSAGPMKIGVSDPYHAEIINHVAQTDDISPLQKMTNTKISGPLMALLPEALMSGGAAAGEAGAAGGIGGLMRGALGAGGLYRGAEGLSDMAQGQFGDQSGGASSGADAQQGAPIEDSSYYAAAGDDFDSPSSITKREDTDDPEDVDPHEKNDGDNKDWQRDFNVNGEGGTSTQPGFSADSPALQRFQMLLPLVMHYFNSEESGANDPLLRQLHESLDRELPGYLHHADDGKAQEIVVMLNNRGQKATASIKPDYSIQPTANTQMNHLAAGENQGPHTQEQIAAVAQFLMAHGREEEVPAMVMQPWNYADELAQVQNKPDTPPDGDLNDNPPEPAVEQTPPNAGMPMPGMDTGAQAQQMMSAALRYGADSIADPCPRCGSHTTKLLTEEGDSKCHNCGNIFATEAVVPSKVGFSIEADDMQPDQPMPEQAPDAKGPQDNAHTWQDVNGQPLQVGQTYEVYSDKYDIPDIVTINNVKPDAIEWTLQGSHELTGRQSISHQEALLDGMTFQPSGSADAPDGNNVTGIEQNDDTVNQTQPGYEQSDLSSPHMMVGSSAENTEHNDPALDWLSPHTAGARFSPMEQKDFIEEAGVARNSDKLDLQGTHYESATEDSFLFGW